MKTRGRKNGRRRHRFAAVQVELLEGRQLLSTAPPSGAPQALVPLSGVSALVADPGRDNIAYVAAASRVYAVSTELTRTVQWGSLQSTGNALAISPDDSRLYVAEGTSIEVLSLPDLTHVQALPLRVPINSLAAGVNHQLYFTTAASSSHTLQQLDLVSGRVVQTLDQGQPNEVRGNAAGTRIYTMWVHGSSGPGMTVDEFDVTGSTFRQVHSYPVYEANPQDFTVDEQHHWVFTSNGGIYGVGATDMTTDTQSFWPFTKSDYGHAVALTPDQTVLYAVGYSHIEAFDPVTGQSQSTYTPQSTVAAGRMTATANGRILYAGSSGGIGEPVDRLGLIGAASLDVVDYPNAHATASLTPGEGTATVSFDASASQPATAGQTIGSYAWDFGDGQSGSGVAVTHSYSAFGTYSATLTVTTSTDLSTEATLPVMVSIAATPHGPYSVSAGTAIALDGTGSRSDLGAIVKYEWDTDYDGQRFTPRLTGSTATFDATGIRGGTGRTIALRVTDSRGNTAMATTTLQVLNVPPTAVLSAAPAPLTGSRTTQFAVTYRDDSAVNISSLGDGDVYATGPNGFQQAARFISTQSASAGEVTAKYEISAPDRTWDGLVNGVYTIQMASGGVTDDQGAAAASGPLGAFDVELPVPAAPDLRLQFAKAPPRLFHAGSKYQLNLKVANVGNQKLQRSRVSVQLYASVDPVLDVSDVLVGTYGTIMDLKPKASTPWNVTLTAPKMSAEGDYYLLAKAAPTPGIKEANKANDIVASPSPAQFVNRFSDLSAEVQDKPGTYDRGQEVFAGIRLTNHGPDRATGVVTVRLYASFDGVRSADDIEVFESAFNISIGRGQRLVEPTIFNAPVSMAGRSIVIFAVIDGTGAGDRNVANNQARVPWRIAVR